MTEVDVAIIGAGVTGLATAHFLHEQDPSKSIAIFEHQQHIGGRIDATKVDSLEVELGADAMVSREPIVSDLIAALGLESQVVKQNIERAMIYTDNELRFLPQKTVLGLPVSRHELKQSGFISNAGLRKYRHLTKKSFAPVEMDISVGTYVRERMGYEVADNIVDPLLGSIHAGSIDFISLKAAAPQLAEMARKGGSIHDVLEPLANTPREPMFVSLEGGMPALTEQLHIRARENGAQISLDCDVEKIERKFAKKIVYLGNGDTIEANDVVVATPSYVAADLLGDDGDASLQLRSIVHASVAMCVLAYPKAIVPELPEASGFLCGHDSLSLMTACSFASNKWDRYNDGEHLVFRVSAGRSDDVRAYAMDDKELVRHLHNELSSILRIDGVPSGAVLRRWPQSFPQYAVGHLQKVDSIEASLAETIPGVHLAGASYRGVGIPSCLRQAKRTAEKIT